MNKKDIDNILNDPIFNISETEKELFTPHDAVRKASKKRTHPDEVAMRKQCEDFDMFRPLFAAVHRELKEGKRSLIRYNEKAIKEGTFYFADGQMNYINKLDIDARQIKDRIRKDGRSKVICEDGTETNILFRTICKNITKDGYVVTEVNNGTELDTLTSVTTEDVVSGWIYVLSSLSQNPEIAGIENLYKIGFSTQPVEERIRNCEHEPTYLMDKVKIIASYKTLNMNVHRFEELIHQFFDHTRFYVKVRNDEGKIFEPQEWFIVPMPIIEETIRRIGDGSILNYMYNRQMQMLEMKPQEEIDQLVANRINTPKYDKTNMKILTLSIKQIFFDAILSGEKNVEYRELKPTRMSLYTEVDKSTGKRYIRRYDALRLSAGYNKDRDILLVEVKDTVYKKEENMIEYHLGKILEYNIKKRNDGNND